MNKKLQQAASIILAAGLVATGATLTPAVLSSTHAANVTLQQWYHEYGEAGTHNAVLSYAKDYTAKTGVNVNVQWIPGDYPTKLTTALLGANGPDVYEFWAVSPADVKAGHVVALDDLFTPAIRADFDKTALLEDTINGHIYGIKMLTDTRFFYYRKSLFKKAGIAHPPATLAELQQDAAKLTTGRIKGLFLGNDGGAGRVSDVLIWSAGGDYVVNNKIAYDTPRVAAAFEKLRELNKSGDLLLGAPVDTDDPSAFIQGQVAIQWSGLWAMPAIKKALGDDFGIFPWPAADTQGRPAASFGGWSEFVNGHSKNIAAAKALVKAMWLQNTAQQIDFNSSYGFHIPPRISAASTDTKLKSGAAADAVSIVHEYGHVGSNLQDGIMSTALGDAIAKILTTNQSVTALIHKAAVASQIELNKELKG